MRKEAKCVCAGNPIKEEAVRLPRSSSYGRDEEFLTVTVNFVNERSVIKVCYNKKVKGVASTMAKRGLCFKSQ